MIMQDTCAHFFTALIYRMLHVGNGLRDSNFNAWIYDGRLRAELEGLKKSALNKRVIAAAGEDKFNECEDSDDPREAAIMLLLDLELAGTSVPSEDNVRRRSSIQRGQPSEKDFQRRASRSSMIFRKGTGSEYGLSGLDDEDDDQAAQPDLDHDEMMCVFVLKHFVGKTINHISSCSYSV